MAHPAGFSQTAAVSGEEVGRVGGEAEKCDLLSAEARMDGWMDVWMGCVLLRLSLSLSPLVSPRRCGESERARAQGLVGSR